MPAVRIAQGNVLVPLVEYLRTVSRVWAVEKITREKSRANPFVFFSRNFSPPSRNQLLLNDSAVTRKVYNYSRFLYFT